MRRCPFRRASVQVPACACAACSLLSSTLRYFVSLSLRTDGVSPAKGKHARRSSSIHSAAPSFTSKYQEMAFQQAATEHVCTPQNSFVHGVRARLGGCEAACRVNSRRLPLATLACMCVNNLQATLLDNTPGWRPGALTSRPPRNSGRSYVTFSDRVILVTVYAEKRQWAFPASFLSRSVLSFAPPLVSSEPAATEAFCSWKSPTGERKLRGRSSFLKRRPWGPSLAIGSLVAGDHGSDTAF